MATEIGAAIHRVPGDFLLLSRLNDIPAERQGEPARFRMTGFTELSYPHSMVVNRAGRRFFDESSFQKGVRAIKAFDQANRNFPNLPCFMIFDRRFQERYSFAERPPGAPAPDWLARADTLAGLAAELGVDASALEETAASFNRGAAEGRDPEFGRGDFLWIQVLSGDSSHPIHPNLAPVSEPPFYGVRLHPSGSSSAGLLTDAEARVLHVRGHPIAGLYACGSAAAQTDFWVGYQGGLLLVRGMTFGYLAARACGGPRLTGVSGGIDNSLSARGAITRMNDTAKPDFRSLAAHPFRYAGRRRRRAHPGDDGPCDGRRVRPSGLQRADRRHTRNRRRLLHGRRGVPAARPCQPRRRSHLHRALHPQAARPGAVLDGRGRTPP